MKGKYGLGKKFASGLAQGRKKGNKAYEKMFFLFGDIFQLELRNNRKNFIQSVADGAELSKLITVNMEALMVTVLETGCRTDWPAYFDGKAYLEWVAKGKKKKGKPVSAHILPSPEFAHFSHPTHCCISL